MGVAKRNIIIEVLFGIALYIIYYLCDKTFLIVPYIIIAIGLLKKPKFRGSPLMYLILPWGFMYTMYISDFIIYSQGTEDNFAVAYTIIGCILICFGCIFAEHCIFRIPEIRHDNTKNLSTLIQIINILSVMGIIGSLLFAYEMVFITGIDLNALALARDTFTSREVTVFTQLGNIMSWGSLLALPAFILLRKYASGFDKFLWIFCTCLYSLYSILSAGRQVVFQILIILISSIIIGRLSQKGDILDVRERKGRKKNVILLIFVATLIVSYCLQVASNRNDGGISDSKRDVLTYYFGNEFNPKIDVVLDALPDQLSDGLAESVVYFTHQLPGFKVFWNIDDSVGPFLGTYSAPFIDRRLNGLGITTMTVDEKMDYVRNYMRSQNAMPVGWKTFFSYLILDYGRIGGLLYCLLYGFYVGYVYKNHKKKNTFMSAMWLIRTNIGLFYTIMFPATCETGLLLWGIFCVFMNMLENRKPALRFVLSEER